MDRIDPTKGYIPGNVQLVCQFVNSGKRHFQNPDVERILESYFMARVEREGYRHYTSSGEYIPESS